MFLGAGLVLSGCGDDDTATTPAPAPPPPPPAPAPEPEPEPMAPATPTGLHVDATTESSITWHWDAVEGALGYVVQANMDGEWDETDTVTFDGVPFTTATEYTATDLDPETRCMSGSPLLPGPPTCRWSEYSDRNVGDASAGSDVRGDVHGRPRRAMYPMAGPPTCRWSASTPSGCRRCLRRFRLRSNDVHGRPRS